MSHGSCKLFLQLIRGNTGSAQVADIDVNGHEVELVLGEAMAGVENHSHVSWLHLRLQPPQRLANVSASGLVVEDELDVDALEQDFAVPAERVGDGPRIGNGGIQRLVDGRR